MAIKEFKGRHFYLSNYFHSPFEFEGEEFSTAEHAFQWAKTTDSKDRECIRTAPTPGYAKKRGQKCQLRSDWREIRVEVMTRLLREKFRQHPKLMKKLLATGNANLVEGNTWNDCYWGVCRGRGKNRLGQVLMMLRKEFKEGCKR